MCRTDFTQPKVIDLLAEEVQQVNRFLDHQSFDYCAPGKDFEAFANEAFFLARTLSPTVIQSLLELRRHASPSGVLLIRGLPIDDTRIGPTPAHWSAEAQTKQFFGPEMYLIALASILGEVFTFSTQHSGNIVQNLVPLRTDMYEQVGTSSKVFLEWHTEDAFHSLRPDFLGLLCLRSDAAAATTFATIKDMDLPDNVRQCLFEPRFQAGIDKAHGGTGNPDDGPHIALLSGRYDDPYVRVDTSCIRAQPGDTEAGYALEHFVNQMSRVAQQVILQAGDALFMDNYRVVHGRTSFTPRFDGTDRWLQRVIVTADLRRSYSARTTRFRSIEPSQAFWG